MTSLIWSKLIKNSLALFSAIMVMSFSGVALAAGQISVSPSTGLTDGQTITVSGTGLAANSTGTIVECNNDSYQPNVTVAGNAVPVSCTNPLSTLINTDASGDLAAHSFTVHTGTIGPAASGSDSTGGSAAADAANYPCPPTAAQIAAGDSCVITVGDAGGDNLSTNISFAAQASPAPASTPSASPNSTKPSGSSAATAAPTTLTNTGPGDVIGLGLGTGLLATALGYTYLRRKVLN